MNDAYSICPLVSFSATKTNILNYIWVLWELLRCRHPQLLSLLHLLECSMSKLHQRFGTKPLTVRHKELRVRIVTLVQSSGEQRSSRQRLVGGCPTFKTHLVPHWRESRCSTGGGGNQPTKQLFWQRMLCCWKDGNMRLWIEEWDIYWSTVINLYHHKLDLFRWRETTDARKEGVVESANLAPKSQWRKRLWNVVIESWLSFWNWIKDPILWHGQELRRTFWAMFAEVLLAISLVASADGYRYSINLFRRMQNSLWCPQIKFSF